ncbi:MAG: hypothetical protein E4H27_00655 [Anaerolineales bacterium]|nr:MAG: hypothetical protein E4H27_00655 [Anaerolineales bacterium]
MGIASMSSHIESPVQEHTVNLANDVQWITGNLRSLGNPHNYINQENLDYFIIRNAHFSPWSFKGLPNSHAPQATLLKDNVHFFSFPDPDSLETFRKPLHTSLIILHLPIAVIRGAAPFLSEATLDNFLDFWKGPFFPMCDVNIHYLSDCATRLPDKFDLLYINRKSVLSYISGS